MKVLTAEQMRALDRRATEQYGIPSLLLMENAGKQAAVVAERMLEDVSGRTITIICGKGNNGGDGFVVARHLHNAGAYVQVFLLASDDEVKGDAKVNLEIARKMDLFVENVESADELADALDSSDLVVDAILGTGIRGEVTGLAGDAIDAINLCSSPVLAIDVPSGLDSDTGAIAGRCVRADGTVTFALPKIGLFTYPGANYVGVLTVADISIPAEALIDNDSKVELTEEEYVAAKLPARPEDANKGTFGHLAVLAGSVGLTGAAAMASEAAARTGAGLVTLGCPESLNDIFEVKLTEVMTVPMPEGPQRCFSLDAIEPALGLIARCDAVAVGPGFGRSEETIKFTHQFLPKIDKPMVIDADGLYALAQDTSVFARLQAPAVITPHPGEMARLAGTEIKDIQSNRLKHALEMAGNFGVVVVLKGAATLIASPDGRVFINPTGSVAMASGGVGDVLTGVIGALLAAGVGPFDAAVCGVYIHGLAGEIAAENVGVAGTVASDVLHAVPSAVRQVSGY